MHQSIDGVYVHTRGWNQPDRRMPRRGGTSCSWAGKPAAGGDKKDYSVKREAYSRKAFPPNRHMPNSNAKGKAATRANAAPQTRSSGTSGKANSSGVSNVSFSATTETRTPVRKSCGTNTQGPVHSVSHDASPVLGSGFHEILAPSSLDEAPRESSPRLVSGVGARRYGGSAGRFARSREAGRHRFSADEHDHECKTTKMSWQEGLLNAIASDDVHQVDILLSRFKVTTRKPKGGSNASSCGTNVMTRMDREPAATFLSDAADLERLDINGLLFGMFIQPLSSRPAPMEDDEFSKTQKNFEFLGYGAPSFAQANRQWIEAASAQHVAAWMNSLRVAKYFMSLGATASTRDGLGVTVYDRASTPEMRKVLRTPPVPRQVSIVSFSHGRCLIGWTISKSYPPVVVFEIRDRRNGFVWYCDMKDMDVYATSRKGKKTLTFEVPKEDIWSKFSYEFVVRAQNSEGFWGDFSEPTRTVDVPHWVSVWNENEGKCDEEGWFSDEDEGQRSARRSGKPERTCSLRLGSVDFGQVPVTQWYDKLTLYQNRSAAKIQALYRGVTAREIYQVLLFSKEEKRRRHLAAKELQRQIRGFLTRQILYYGDIPTPRSVSPRGGDRSARAGYLSGRGRGSPRGGVHGSGGRHGSPRGGGRHGGTPRKGGGSYPGGDTYRQSNNNNSRRPHRNGRRNLKDVRRMRRQFDHSDDEEDDLFASPRSDGRVETDVNFAMPRAWRA